MTPEQRRAALEWFTLQLEEGVAETTGRNDGEPARRYMRGDRLPWCAGFVLTGLGEVGVEVPGGYYPNRKVEDFERNLKGAGKWISPLEVPEPCDVVFFDRRLSSDRGLGRHCAVVEHVDEEGGLLVTIEGNSSNRVARRAYSLTDPSITGYGRL